MFCNFLSLLCTFAHLFSWLFPSMRPLLYLNEGIEKRISRSLLVGSYDFIITTCLFVLLRVDLHQHDCWDRKHQFVLCWKGNIFVIEPFFLVPGPSQDSPSNTTSHESYDTWHSSRSCWSSQHHYSYICCLICKPNLSSIQLRQICSYLKRNQRSFIGFSI